MFVGSRLNLTFRVSLPTLHELGEYERTTKQGQKSTLANIKGKYLTGYLVISAAGY